MADRAEFDHGVVLNLDFLADECEARDSERSHLARWLHDELAQLLVGVQMQLALLPHPDDEVHGGSIRQIDELVAQALMLSRLFIAELMGSDAPDIRQDVVPSSSIVPEPSLECSLEQELERELNMMKAHGIATSIRSDGGLQPTDAEVTAALVRSTRELLANVRKHSQAESVTIAVTRQGELIRVTVSDTGIGFDQDALARSVGHRFGLVIVRERLAEVGGKIEIVSARSAGTLVTMEAPLSGKA